MPRPSVRIVGEVVAVVSVVLSLVFVCLQLRQSTIAETASAYQELGIAMSEGFRIRATDRGLNDVLAGAASSDPAVWATMSDSDKDLARVYVLSVMRVYQSAFLEVREGLLRPEALEELGISGFKRSNLLQNVWPRVKVSLSPESATYLEAEMDLPPE